MLARNQPLPASFAIGDDLPFAPPMCAIFRRFLKRQGLKFTAERAMILEAVLGREGVFEADNLLYEMRQAGHRVSKATIYRTLKHLLEAGIIAEVLIDSKQSRYQLSFGRKPRGHLVCGETGRIIEFDNPAMIALRDRICRAFGYEPVGFQFTVYGISPGAQAPESDAVRQVQNAVDD
jgi:Fur family ferric uptake transcriptional regulator